MSQLLLFADEAGCLVFNASESVSRFFIICSVILKNDDPIIDLVRLRRELIWRGEKVGSAFHASPDRQSVRDAVFGTILPHDFTVQATIFEKAKASPDFHNDGSRFFRSCWYKHFHAALKDRLLMEQGTLITSAAIGTGKQRAAFERAVADAVSPVLKPGAWRASFVPAANDPGVQIADYCAWAIHRKWERKDMRSYELIKTRITHEWDVWGESTKRYY